MSADDVVSKEDAARAWAVFEDGLRAQVFCWNVIQMAINGEWGGLRTVDKVIDFVENMLDYFATNRNPDPFFLEKGLRQFLEAALSCIVDDNLLLLGEDSIRMMEECAAGNFHSAHVFIDMAIKKKFIPVGYLSCDTRENVPENESSKSADSGAAEGQSDNRREATEENVCPEDGSSGDTTPAPTDDDGWSVVTKKRRR
mmetsp:Transcript_10013/g.28168  ORF Transcript_10013/g.28168 Transcript_10013/m.28168 type:complete len:199 (+) Transcript_10013:125-721(+)